MTSPFVALFRGQSQYGAVCAHVDDLAEAFQAEGLATRVVDLEQPDLPEQIVALHEAALRAPLRLVHGMVGWGAPIGVQGRSLYDVLGVPFVHHMQDPPYYTHERLLEGPERRYSIAVHDSAYESYLRRLPGLTRTRRVLTCGGAAPAAPLRDHADRDIDVLIAMSVTPPAALEAELQTLPAPLRPIVLEIVEETLDRPDLAIHDVVFRRLAARGVDRWFADPVRYSGEVHLSRSLMIMAYQQVHARRRLRLAAQLLQLPAVIHGVGWDQLEVPDRRAEVRGVTDFRTIQQLSTRARIVLNVMPPVNDAPHDRTFYAMLAGAAYLTDPNAFFRREFTAARDILHFDLRSRTLVDEVESLLARPSELAAVAEAGRAAVAARHTWRHRARELLALAGTAPLASHAA